MRRTAHALLAFVSLIPTAIAGTISGKVTGWSPGIGYSTRVGVVWLEGATTPPATLPHVLMVQQGGRFVPAFMVAVVGQTVEIPNRDEVAHNVYSFSPPKTFNFGFYAKGEQKSVTFERPGLEEIGCSIHSFMHAKILVVPNLYYSILASDGSFLIRDVPAGKYTIKFWTDGTATVSQDVEVASEGTTRLDIAAPSSGTSK